MKEFRQIGTWLRTHAVQVMAVASMAWFGLILSSPLAPTPVVFLVYGFSARICHQIAERSFHLGGHQLAVCARCTGIYAGAAVALVGLLLVDRGRSWSPLVGNEGRRARWWLACGLLPTVVSVVLESMGLWQTSNVQRAIAGAPLGAAVAFVAGRAATIHLRSDVPSAASGATIPQRQVRR